MVQPIVKGQKIITQEALEKIKTGEKCFLEKLYFHSNDSVQKALIEVIYTIQGWHFETFEDEPPKQYA